MFEREAALFVFSLFELLSNNRRLFPYMPKRIAFIGPYDMNGRESPRKNPLNLQNFYFNFIEFT